MGDEEVRASMLEVADALLVFWREGSGNDLAQLHPTLAELWTNAASLLVSFEVKRFKKALSACWDQRQDAALLAVAIEDLVPEGNRRVEFARCLYHLELARMFVDSSRAEFAKRAGLLSEAYQSSAVAEELIGDDPGLAHLWRELLPYLDEFFEMMEEEANSRIKTDPNRLALGRSDVKTDPNATVVVAAPVPEMSFPGIPADASALSTLKIPPPQESLRSDDTLQWLAPGAVSRDSGIATEDEFIEVTSEFHTVVEAPPPPDDLTPPGSWHAPPSEEVVEVFEAEMVPEPPKPSAPPPLPTRQRRPAPSLDVVLNDGYAPDAVTLAFWKHTFEALNLLPDPKTPRGTTRLLSADSRADRKRLNDYLETLWTHSAVPEARTFGCLLRLLMAGQLKEKTLFGSPNARRAEAFAMAFSLLSKDPLAAAHSASWFQLDGFETETALQRGLEVLMEFLGWCAREARDPLDVSAHKEFLNLPL